MSTPEIQKDEHMRRRVDGAGTTPIIENVAGNGSEYTQAWKIGRGPNWIEYTQAKQPVRAYGAFFRRSKGE